MVYTQDLNVQKYREDFHWINIEIKNVKYLVLPKEKFSLDLNGGYEQFISCNDPEGLKFVFKFIEHEFKNLYDSKKKKLPYHFVTMRGFLRDLICTPFNTSDPWIILATKFKGTIYLMSVQTEKKKNYEKNRNEYEKKCEFYGRNFETFIVSDKPNEAPQRDPFAPVKNGEGLHLALSTKYGYFKLFYCAEVDCAEGTNDGKSIQDLKFAELKTNLKIASEAQNGYFRKKLLKWWCQSYLAGIGKIYYGLRTKEGLVDQIANLNVEEIPLKCQKEWSDSITLQFGLDFLSTVDETMADIDCPYTVFRFEFDIQKGKNITFQRCVSKTRTNQSFIPEKYISLFR